MNKTNNKILASGLCLLALQLPSSNVILAQDGCEVQEVPPVCQSARRININVNSKNIAPPNICVEAGVSIPVRVTPRGSSARIAGKGDAEWLNGSGESFTLEVPGTAAGEFDYAVYFDDGSCIDPRITVKN